MALIPEVIDIPFAGGLDTKTDDKRVMPTKLLALENALFTAPGKLKKANGSSPLGASILAGASITAGQALMTKGNELLLADGSSLYSWSPSASKWVNQGACPSVYATSQPLALNQYSIAGYDLARHSSGLMCAVYEKWSGGIGGTYIGADYSVIDGTTGETIYTGSIATPGGLAVNCAAPKVVCLGSNFLIYYLDVTTNPRVLHVVVVSTSTPQTKSSDTALSSGTTTSAVKAAVYDVAVSSTTVYITFKNGSATPGLTTWGCLSATPSIVSYTRILAATNGTTCCVFWDQRNAGPVVAYDSDTGPYSLKYALFDPTLSSTLFSDTLESGLALPPVVVTGVSTSSGAVGYSFFYSVGRISGAYDLGSTRVQTVGAAFALGTAAVLLNSVHPCGGAFSKSGTAYVPLAFDTSDRPHPEQPQNTYFIADGSGNIAARIFSATAGGVYSSFGSGGAAGAYSLPHTVTLTADASFILPCTSAYRLISVSTQYYLQTAMFGVTLSFTDTANRFGRGELGKALHVGGASMQVYDGAGVVVEHGFHYYPYAITNSASGSGSIAAGTYQYVVCYEWTDANGFIHRSAPSAVLTVVNGSSSATNTLTIPTLRLTAKQTTRQVQIVVYRTEASGTTFYQVNNLGNAASTLLLNDPTTSTVTYADKLADASITSNPQIYTTGGVLENDPPPPCGQVVVHQNRLWALDSTNKLQVWYSKKVTVGAPVEWSGFQVMMLDPRGGDGTAIAGLDDKFISFKADRAFYIPGQGPDSTGGQDDFPSPILVTSDTGCTEAKSIVTVPDGLMFKGAKGFYLLGRDLSVSYIGAAVESYNSQTVTSAVLMPSANQVRFTLSGGPVLIYDYLMRQWGARTGISAVDSALWSSSWVSLTSAGASNQEGTSFTDNGTAIALRAKTAWLSFAKVQGYQRVWRVLVLGTYKSAHTLTVKLYYDYGTAAETHTFTVSSDPAPYQFVVKPNKQKCEAIQVEITETPTGGSGESCDLSGLAVQVGILKGAARRPAAQSG